MNNTNWIKISIVCSFLIEALKQCSELAKQMADENFTESDIVYVLYQILWQQGSFFIVHRTFCFRETFFLLKLFLLNLFAETFFFRELFAEIPNLADLWHFVFSNSLRVIGTKLIYKCLRTFKFKTCISSNWTNHWTNVTKFGKCSFAWDRL